LLIAVAACGSTPPPAKPIAEAPVSDAGADQGTSAAAPPDGPAFQIDYAEAERVAFLRAKPVFVKHCARCHTKTRKATRDSLDSFDMQTYPFGGKHKKIIGNTIRDVLGQSGVPATMPKDKKRSVVGDDLALILAWSDAWARAHGETPNEP